MKPMAGYSGTPLFKKLGIKEGFKIYIKNRPEDYLELIAPLPADVKIVSRLTKELDMIHLFTKSRKELNGLIDEYADRIKPNGMIWISWPKKASKVPTDVTEDVLRADILPSGYLVDVKVCAVDATWSALKFVIRKEKRAQKD